VPQVGGKNSATGELLSIGVPAPSGFAVTTHAYGCFIDAVGIRPNIDEILVGAQTPDARLAAKAAAQIHRLIMSRPLPDEVEDAVRSAYELLAQECGLHDAPVAVRSSATAEDAPVASFAGQHDTFLWVTGARALLDRCKECMASLFTARAIYYRSRMGLTARNVAMSVGVQTMVNAQVAGVLTTLDPANGDHSKIVVEAAWGLGSSVVAGDVTPDAFVVDKVAFEVVRRVIAAKTVEHVVDREAAAVVHRDVPAERQSVPCLTDGEILDLVRLAKAMEAHYGAPQTIEWAIDRELPATGNIRVLQTRPETTWSQRERVPVGAEKGNILEHMLDALREGRKLR
jgi:pyruvate,water dikinase